MKKLIFVLFAAVLTFSISSCNSCSPIENSVSTELTYDVTATADGIVEFTWPYGGSANVDGKAVVKMCNDTIVVEEALSLDKALVANDAEVVDAANQVLDMFSVKGIEGQYHLSIVGYVKYGAIIFAINEYYPPVNDSTIVQ